MGRLLYEHSASYSGHLVIPFVLATIWRETIYSYRLLSDQGNQGKFHKATNPSEVCDRTLTGILYQAREFLARQFNLHSEGNYFQRRYTYCNHLIITHETAGRWFYDHYALDELHNIAAPKLFSSEHECLMWVRQGLDCNQFQSDAFELTSKDNAFTDWSI